MKKTKEMINVLEALKVADKKVLLVGTGALHSKTSVQQNNVIPVVAHAIEIEVVE